MASHMEKEWNDCNQTKQEAGIHNANSGPNQVASRSGERGVELLHFLPRHWSVNRVRRMHHRYAKGDGTSRVPDAIAKRTELLYSN